MKKYLIVGVSLFALFAANNAMAAGYVCEELIEYTSCMDGYYLTNGDCIASAIQSLCAARIRFLLCMSSAACGKAQAPANRPGKRHSKIKGDGPQVRRRALKAKRRKKKGGRQQCAAGKSAQHPAFSM